LKVFKKINVGGIGVLLSPEFDEQQQLHNIQKIEPAAVNYAKVNMIGIT